MVTSITFMNSGFYLLFPIVLGTTDLSPLKCFIILDCYNKGLNMYVYEKSYKLIYVDCCLLIIGINLGMVKASWGTKL